MNASTTVLNNDNDDTRTARHYNFLQSFSNNANNPNPSINSSAETQITSGIHPPRSSSLLFPSTTLTTAKNNENRNCDSVEEENSSLESVSSTDNSIIDSSDIISFGNHQQKDIPFPFYPFSYGNSSETAITTSQQPVLNPFFGFPSHFPSVSASYKATTTATQGGYPYQSHFFRGGTDYRSSNIINSNSTTPTATTSSSVNENIILTNNNHNTDIFAAGAATATPAATTGGASTSGVNNNNHPSSSSSSVSSSNSSRSNTTTGVGLGPSNTATLQSAATAATSSSSDEPIQRLAQMTHGVGAFVKSETGNSDGIPNLDYQNAMAYAQAQAQAMYGNYYQFYNQMPPAAAAAASLPGWPGYSPHWANSKKGRQTYQRYQTGVLEDKFRQSSYVSKKQREELRAHTNLTDRQIKIWFQNRRMKAKKEKIRVDDQTNEHQTLIPANPPKNNMMPGSNGSMHHQHQQQQLQLQNHLLMDDPLGLGGLDHDKLKSNNNQSNSMLNNPQNSMWCSSINMNGNGSGMMHGMSMADSMWPMLPQSAAAHLHSQGVVNVTSAAAGGGHPHYMGYPICPPNI